MKHRRGRGEHCGPAKVCKGKLSQKPHKCPESPHVLNLCLSLGAGALSTDGLNGNHQPHRIHGIRFTCGLLGTAPEDRELKQDGKQLTEGRTDTCPEQHTCTTGLERKKGVSRCAGKKRENEGNFH